MNHVLSNWCRALAGGAWIVASGGAAAQSWMPVTGGGASHSAQVEASQTFPIPPSIAARGGSIRAILVGGGQGGSASGSNCADAVLQGGTGGDGGEVDEIDINLVPGQCPTGLVVAIGAAGHGALRSGNGGLRGEAGGITTVSCTGNILARAFGGGSRPDVLSATRAARGGAGGVVMNTLESSNNATFDQRSFTVRPGEAGQMGYLGYGSGGGGGGMSTSSVGVRARPDGTSVKERNVLQAPFGKGGYGAGSGAGTLGYAPATLSARAENALQFGAGGGGGAGMCAGGNATADGGDGASGVVRFTWAQ